MTEDSHVLLHVLRSGADAGRHLVARLARAGLPPAPRHVHATRLRSPAAHRVDRWCRAFDRYSWNLLAALLAIAGATIAIIATRPGYVDALIEGVM